MLESGSLAVELLEMGKVLHDCFQEVDLFLTARVVLKREFFEVGQPNQLADFEHFDFYAIIGEEDLL